MFVKFITAFEVESNSGPPSQRYVLKMLGLKYKRFRSASFQVEIVRGHKGFIVELAQCTPSAPMEQI